MVLVGASFVLVSTRFKSRQLYTSLDRLEAQAQELETDWRRLQLDRAELTRSTRIARIARNDIGLISSNPSNTIFLRGNNED